MLLVNLFWVFLPLLLAENVQAADKFFGTNRNWNRRPIALASRPNPIHSEPKPLPEPIEVERDHDVVLENKEPISIDNNLSENDQSTLRPTYRLLSPREPLLRPSTLKPPAIIITTETTTVEDLQTTSLYTNPPEVPSSDDIQVIRTKTPSSNPTLGRTLLPRPLPGPERKELPLHTLEAKTTEEPLVIVLPDSQSPSVTPENGLEHITKPEEPKIELLEEAPIEATETVKPEAALEILPEKVEETSKPKVIVLESQARSVPNKRPEIGTHPYRVPKPVVSSPRPNLVVTKPPLKLTSPKEVTKPFLRTLIPSNPGSEWTTPSPKQLFDYKCKEADGYYGIAGDCDNYVECKKYTAIMYSCPDGLHYNPKARWPEYPCGYPSDVKCESNSVRQVAHPTDECPQQYGFYSLADSDCTKYIMCQEGKAFVMNCPLGLVFSAATSSCDWSENVPSCKPDVFRGFTCPAPLLEEDGSPSDFIYKYRYKESCKEYIACQHGHPRLLRCDAGLAFDEESEVCVDSDYVTNCRY